jgi:hypothetical protein
MPRLARLDTPGTSRHVIVRGKACEDDGVQLAHLQSGTRGAAVSRCRSKVARHLVEGMGLPLAEAARRLGVCTSAIWHAIRRAKQSQLNEVKDVP